MFCFFVFGFDERSKITVTNRIGIWLQILNSKHLAAILMEEALMK